MSESESVSERERGRERVVGWCKRRVVVIYQVSVVSFPVIALERELSSGLEWINATRLHRLWMPNPRATGGRGNSPPIDSGNEWTIPPLTVSLTSLCSPSTLRLLHMFDAKTYFCLRYCTVYTQAITEMDTESALGSSPCTIIRLPEIRSL